MGKALFCLALVAAYVLLLVFVKKDFIRRTGGKISALFLILFCSSFLSPQSADAATTMSMDDRGGYYKTGPYYYAATDSIRYDFNTQDIKSQKIEYFHDRALTQAGTVRESTASTYIQSILFNCDGYYRQTLYSASGAVLLTFTVEVSPGDLKNPSCDSSANDGETEGGKTCDACELFKCPGWSEYMGKLDAIKAAIPPPPDWPKVADIFRDSIAPQIKKDMAEVIGRAPEPTMPDLPKAPDLPTAPAQPPKLDDKGFKAPTGEEAPGLDDAGFSADDIKNKAPAIPEREDPTGGFDIIDPIGSLPSQEEFIKNAPEEGTAPLPAPPKDPDNMAPTPGETADAPPVPKDTPDAPPVPGSDNSTAPIPGADNSTAPVPGTDGSTAPIPGMR